MLNILWFLDAKPWEQMYFIGMVGGISLFTILMMETIQKAKKDFWIWMKNR
jgi:hypothetical protein